MNTGEEESQLMKDTAVSVKQSGATTWYEHI